MRLVTGFRSVVAAAFIAGLAACASSAGPGRAAGVPVGLLRASDVLIACDIPEPSVRATCEDQLADEVEVRGSRPIRLPADARQPNGSVSQAQLLGSARALHAVAILVLSLAPVESDERPSFSLGLGGFGGSFGGGVGVTAPIGGARPSTAYAGRGTVVEVSTGQLVWSDRGVAPPSDDLPSQLGGLAITLLDSAERVGLF